MITLFILGLLIIVSTTIIIHMLSDEDIRVLVNLMLFAVGEFFIIISLSEHHNKPSVIDVYQGKTTLEITYRDSIPVDSVVVFKNKEK